MGITSGSQPMAQTWFPSHQLSSGLYVSGHRDPSKEKGSTISVPQTPYTGGDVRKSGELGKMAGLIHSASLKSGSSSSRVEGGTVAASSTHSGPLSSNAATSTRSPLSTSGPLSSAGVPWHHSKSMGSQSGPITAGGGGGTRALGRSTSGPLTRQQQVAETGAVKSSGGASSFSGPLSPAVLPATGLITSSPLAAGSRAVRVSGSQDNVMATRQICDGTPALKAMYHAVQIPPINPAISNLSNNARTSSSSFRKRFPKVILWIVIPLFAMGFIAGAFIVAAVQNPILLIVVASLLGLLLLFLTWNSFWGHHSITSFIATFPESELGTAKDGQFVKVTGVVTCGSVPLESSYQKRFVVDFYISDLQTGTRALVKSGCGASVTPYVDESVILDVNPKNKEQPADFIRWLSQRNLSADERVMQLREGHVKEGSTVTVMGVLQRHENVLMIVPPPGPVSTGCQWSKALLPGSMEGLIMRCQEVNKVDGIPL
ncbi:hypothetical protein BDL97_10G019500 [Sphagnum fallax]|nr:hypothetical protein BDL97_10G019500 [Sphagnum fallax]